MDAEQIPEGSCALEVTSALAVRLTSRSAMLEVRLPPDEAVNFALTVLETAGRVLQAQRLAAEVPVEHQTLTVFFGSVAGNA